MSGSFINLQAPPLLPQQARKTISFSHKQPLPPPFLKSQPVKDAFSVTYIAGSWQP